MRPAASRSTERGSGTSRVTINAGRAPHLSAETGTWLASAFVSSVSAFPATAARAIIVNTKPHTQSFMFIPTLSDGNGHDRQLSHIQPHRQGSRQTFSSFRLALKARLMSRHRCVIEYSGAGSRRDADGDPNYAGKPVLDLGGLGRRLRDDGASPARDPNSLYTAFLSQQLDAVAGLGAAPGAGKAARIPSQRLRAIISVGPLRDVGAESHPRVRAAPLVLRYSAARSGRGSRPGHVPLPQRRYVL